LKQGKKKMSRYRVVTEHQAIGSHTITDDNGEEITVCQTNVRCGSINIEDLNGCSGDRIVCSFSDINIADDVCEFLNKRHEMKKAA